MPALLTSTCPACQATVSDDDRVCAACGAEVGGATFAERTPLILPGSPAFTADTVRNRPSSGRVIGAGIVAVAAIAGVTMLIITREPPPIEGGHDAIALSTYYTTADSVAAVNAPRPQFADTALTAAADVAPRAVASTVEPVQQDSAPPVAFPEPAPAAPSVPVPRVTLPPPVTSRTDSRVAIAPPPVPAPASRTLPRRTTATAAAVPGATRATAAAARTAASRTAASRTATARTAASRTAAALSAPVPVLRLVGLPSETMVTGGSMSLRWTIRDQRTGRPMTLPIAFTSSDQRIATVDRRTGAITARTAGRVRIIADGGAAGQAVVSLTVRAPEVPTVVARIPAERLPARAQIGTATNAPTPVSAPVPPPVSTGTTAGSAAASNMSRAVRSVGAADIRTAVDRFVAQVRSGTTRNSQFSQFFADGEDHRVVLVAGPNTVSTSGGSVRVAFELRLSKYDSAGRPLTRIAPVSMDVDQGDSGVNTSAVAVGTLYRP